MTKVRIATYALIPLVLGLAFFLANIIKAEISEEKNIQKTEALIKDKLEYIRDIQVAYYSQKGQYASSWDSLKHFVMHGKLYITQRREEAYGAFDSIRVEVDTLNVINVKDSLYNSPKERQYNLDKLAFIPGSNKQFDLFAGSIKKNNVDIQVFEIKNTDPVDPNRTDPDHPKDTLRVGSRNSAKTTGNW